MLSTAFSWTTTLPQLSRIHDQAVFTLSATLAIRPPFSRLQIQSPRCGPFAITRTSLQFKPIRLARKVLPISPIISIHQRAHMHTSLESCSDRLLQNQLLWARILEADVDGSPKSDLSIVLSMSFLDVREVNNLEVLKDARFDE
ncbi:hypothetical protein V3481_008551 [Fusarium oxysporum f. sp. vasinfectum]